MEENRIERLAAARLGGRGLAWAAVAWVLGATAHFYVLRPLHLFISWPWVATPAWRLDLMEPWQGPPWDIIAQGGLLVWIAAAVGVVGWGAMRRFDPANRGLARLVWGSGLVLGALGMLVFFVGVAGGLARSVFVAMLGVLSLGAAWAAVRAGWTGWTKWTEWTGWTKRTTRTEWAILAGCALLQLLTLLYCLTPSIQSDALRYHLAAPQEWLKAGRLTYLPYNAFSNFPSTVEMLFLFGLGLAGDLLAKGFHFLFFPLTTGAIALLTDEAIGEGFSRGNRGPDSRATPVRVSGIRPWVLSAAVWSASPVVIPLAAWDYIDLAVLLFGLGVVYYLIRWARSRRIGDWVLAAVFGGLLCASKYTGVLTVLFGAIILSVFTLAVKTDESWRVRLGAGVRRAVLFGLLSAAIASPWWIKSAIYTGNPVYPMAWGVFGGGEWTQVNTDVYVGKTREKGEGRDLRALLRLPWATAMYPRTFEDTQIGPFYWIFTPWILVWGTVGLWRWRRTPGSAMVSLWGAFFVLSIFYTYQSNRFLLPVWALGTVAACAALAGMSKIAARDGYAPEAEISARNPGRYWEAAALAVFFLPILYNAADSARWLLFDTGRFALRDNRFPESRTHWPAYTLGYLSRDQFLAFNVSYYPAAKYANEHLGPKDKVLLVGEHRKMHWRVRVEGNDWYDLPRIRPFLRAGKTADDALDCLLAAGFTHLFVNLDEWAWPRDPLQQTGEKPADFGSAWNYNIRFLSRDDILKIREILRSPRLRVEVSVVAGRVFLCRVAPKSQKIDGLVAHDLHSRSGRIPAGVPHDATKMESAFPCPLVCRGGSFLRDDPSRRATAT